MPCRAVPVYLESEAGLRSTFESTTRHPRAVHRSGQRSRLARRRRRRREWWGTDTSGRGQARGNGNHDVISARRTSRRSSGLCLARALSSWRVSCLISFTNKYPMRALFLLSLPSFLPVAGRHVAVHTRGTQHHVRHYTRRRRTLSYSSHSVTTPDARRKSAAVDKLAWLRREALSRALIRRE